MQVVILCSKTLILSMAINGALAMDGGEGNGRVEGGVQAIEVVKEMSDFVLKG